MALRRIGRDGSRGKSYDVKAKMSRMGPRLVYQQRALPLVGGIQTLGNDVEVLYQHRQVARLTKTYVVTWNVGRVIRAGDVCTEDPLRLEVSGDAQILAARIVKSSSKSDVSLRQDRPAQKNIAIAFDELGRGEGAVFEVLHTSSERFVTLRGRVSGMPTGPQDRGRIRHPFNPLPWQIPSGFKAIGNTAFVLTFGIGALLVLLSAFGSYLMPVFGPHVAPVMSVIEGVSDAIYAGLALIVIAQTRQRFPEDLVIPELVD